MWSYVSSKQEQPIGSLRFQPKAEKRRGDCHFRQNFPKTLVDYGLIDEKREEET